MGKRPASEVLKVATNSVTLRFFEGVFLAVRVQMLGWNVGGVQGDGEGLVVVAHFDVVGNLLVAAG